MSLSSGVCKKKRPPTPARLQPPEKIFSFASIVSVLARCGSSLFVWLDCRGLCLHLNPVPFGAGGANTFIVRFHRLWGFPSLVSSSVGVCKGKKSFQGAGCLGGAPARSAHPAAHTPTPHTPNTKHPTPRSKATTPHTPSPLHPSPKPPASKPQARCIQAPHH